MLLTQKEHFISQKGWELPNLPERDFVLEVILLTWNFTVERELGLSHVTVHVCTLPPDNQKGGSGDAHVTQAQRFEIAYVKGVTIQNMKHLGSWQPRSSALCGFQAV